MSKASDLSKAASDARAEKLEAWVKIHFDSQQAFIDKFHLNQGEISNIIKKRRVLGERRARKLEQQANMPAMYLDGLSEVNPAGQIQIQINDPKNEAQRQVLTPVEPWDSNTPLEDDEIEIPFYKDFKFACGSGKFGEKAIKETRRLRISKLTLRNRGIEFINASAATATDNSMAPTINEGATILIDCGRKKIKDGQIFIFQHGDGEFADYRCKRLYNLPLGGVRIVSDNAEEYPEERLSAQEIQDQHFVVLGWVFSVQQLFTW